MLSIGSNHLNTYLQHKNYNDMHFLDTLLSFIAPHACVACGTTGTVLCDNCLDLLPVPTSSCYRCRKATANYATCPACRKVSALESVWICTDYETAAQKLVGMLKFERVYASAAVIARAMQLQFLGSLPTDVAVSHLPTATSRVRQRGYDQAQLIAKKLSAYTEKPYINTLERHGQQRQTGSKRAQRLVQLEGAFQARRRAPGGELHIILIDDVMTTGASLESAANVLKRAGVSQVSAIVFARRAM